jgi:hypothetical protein
MLFSILMQNALMKYLLLLLFTSSSYFAQSQKIDSIYVNLYTDSLKRGTYNYINIDGLLSNGHYLPLDSSYLEFSATAGKFEGNSLWVAPDFTGEKISITVTLKQDRALHKEFDMYIKQKADGPLKTEKEILEELKQQRRKKS